MKNNRQHFVFILLTILLLSAACSRPKIHKHPVKENYVVLLDLSDRILAPHQAGQDIAVIMQVFGRFEKKVFSQLIVNSNDKFSIRIIPQEDSPLDIDSLENMLMLDMNNLSFREKKTRLLTFKGHLRPVLEKLYGMAWQGGKSTDYQGVDIWRYFNRKLQYDLLQDYQNHLVVLTDGYFDFESYKYTIRKGNRYTSTIFLGRLNRSDWKAFAEKSNIGLLPVTKKFPETIVTVTGINPKGKILGQAEKLTCFWKKWLREMNFKTCNIIEKNNTAKLVEVLQKTKI